MKKININDLVYPHVVHITTTDQHRALKKVSPSMTSWNQAYTYYLIGASGFATTRDQYEGHRCSDGEEYRIFEFDEIDFGDPEPNYYIIY